MTVSIRDEDLMAELNSKFMLPGTDKLRLRQYPEAEESYKDGINFIMNNMENFDVYILCAAHSHLKIFQDVCPKALIITECPDLLEF